MGSAKKKQKGKQNSKQQNKPRQTSAPKAKGAAEHTGRYRYVSLTDELTTRGLRIVQVAADGNCFFRAVSDQLTGSEKDHIKIRENVVQYMERHQDEFAPFVEDDEGFDKYMKRMRKNATWAGHMEVQATSMCYDTNIHIYQQGQPTWRVVNFQPAQTSPCLHLSFHDSEHYNSVRCQGDSGEGPAEPVRLVHSPCEDTADSGAVFGEKDVRQVSENTCCFDLDIIKDALASCGNVEDATEMIIRRMGQPTTGGTAQNTSSDVPQIFTDKTEACPEVAPSLASGVHVTVSLKIAKKRKKVSVVLEVETSKSGKGYQPATGQPVHAGRTDESKNAPTENDAGMDHGLVAEAPVSVVAEAETEVKAPVKGKRGARVGKNKQCPCRSGVKYKNCCGKVGKPEPTVSHSVQASSNSTDVPAPSTPERFGSIDI